MNLVTIAHNLPPASAVILKSLLDASGIESFLTNLHGSRLEGPIGMDLQVREIDAPVALQVIESGSSDEVQQD